MAFTYPTPEQVKATNPSILRQDAIEAAVQLAADEEASRLGDEIREAMAHNAPPWKFVHSHAAVWDKDMINFRARRVATDRHRAALKRAWYCAKLEFSDDIKFYVLVVILKKG